MLTATPVRCIFVTMAESLASVVEGLRRQVEALQGLKSEVVALRLENRELRTLLEPLGARAKNVSLTLRREEESVWKVVGRNSNRGAIAKVSGTGSTLAVKNSFAVLNDQCTGVQEKTDETTLSSRKKGKIVVVGDSQVRGLGRLFCARDSERRMCVCLPGAGIGDVADRLEGVLAGEGEAPTVVISAGGNDIGRTRPEEIFRRYREALGRVRDLGGTPVLCGVLPRRLGPRWWSEACALNSRLAGHCRRNGWLFVDNWSYFFGKDHLYTRDGVHLSGGGTGALAWSLTKDLGGHGFLGRV